MLTNNVHLTNVNEKLYSIVQLYRKAARLFAVDLYVELDDYLLPTRPFLGLPLFALLFEKLEAGPY